MRNGQVRRSRSLAVGMARATALVTLLGMTVVPSAGAGIPGAGAKPSSPAVAAIGHPYRHGVAVRRSDRGLTSAISHNLIYRGGTAAASEPARVGVTTGAPRVYLVFWGSQWGTAGVDGNGNSTLSGDPQSVAPALQAFFKGLGTGGELWSGVMTQYCQGIAAGATFCGSGSTRVGYPSGGALAGVWRDGATSAPAAATAHQIAAEAVSASTHFGNLTAASNRNAQYVIVSPTGTNPDNWLSPTSGYCAWHDYNADPFLGGGPASSPNGALAFTNLPYIPDAGYSCGRGFVNSPGALDGVTIVEGHEYAETVTDQFPAGGWTDSSGAENGDKCAWIASGVGASQNLVLTTGTFAVQTTWANDASGGAGGCEVSHAIGASVGPSFTTVSSATLSATLRNTFVVKATGGTATTMSESGALPSGISFNPGAARARLTGIAATGAVGVYPLVFTASNAAGATTQSFTLYVVPPRKFISAHTATFTHAVSGTFTVTTQGSFGAGTSGPPVLPVITESPALPSGITFADNGDGTATISGTTAAIGSYKIAITASAGIRRRQVFTLKVV